MKKRYVISILAIFMFSLSFFAYNKLSNKEISEYNNTIGIYLEDDYESNTYTLSDSSDIPTDDYIFNAEKTNEECPNATFSYDSESNKVQVNSNKTIQCNLYFKEKELEQLVNYQFLYDGSLGNATANQMSSVTGGWSRLSGVMKIEKNGSDYYFHNNYGILNNDSIYLTYNWQNAQGYGCYGTQLVTNSIIDIENFDYLTMKVNSEKILGTSGVTFVFLKSNSISNYGWYSPHIYAKKTGIHFLDPISISELNTTKAYGSVNVTTCSGSAIRSGYVYQVILYKIDDYKSLASKINVTVSSINDLLDNYSTQILNNEKAINFMLKQCTGEFMVKAIQNNIFMNAYQNSPYKSLIDANVHWKKFIDMSVV